MLGFPIFLPHVLDPLTFIPSHGRAKASNNVSSTPRRRHESLEPRQRLQHRSNGPSSSPNASVRAGFHPRTTPLQLQHILRKQQRLQRDQQPYQPVLHVNSTRPFVRHVANDTQTTLRLRCNDELLLHLRPTKTNSLFLDLRTSVFNPRT